MKTDNIDIQTGTAGGDFPDLLMNSSQRIIACKIDYQDGLSYPFHHHPPIQLSYASSGVMTVTTMKGIWVVPNSRAVWIPSNIHHKIEASGQLSMRNLYIRPDTVPNLPSQCGVVGVPPLLRELILYAAEFPVDYKSNSPEERTMDVILDLIHTLDTTPLMLPISQDPRLKIITNAIIQNPADNRTLEKWGEFAGATSRTLNRLFRKETGMSFRHWRQQARLLEALRQLAVGEQVSTVAWNLGYDSVSAFVYMFRKSLGITPGQYFHNI